MNEHPHPHIVRDVEDDATTRSLVLNDVAQDFVRAIVRAWPRGKRFDPEVIRIYLSSNGTRMDAEDRIARVTHGLIFAGALTIPLHPDDCEAIRAEADEAVADYDPCENCHAHPGNLNGYCWACSETVNAS